MTLPKHREGLLNLVHKGISAYGEIKGSSFTLMGTTSENLYGKFILKNGEIRIEDVSFHAGGGKAFGSGNIQFTKDFFINANFHLKANAISMLLFKNRLAFFRSGNLFADIEVNATNQVPVLTKSSVHQSVKDEFHLDGKISVKITNVRSQKENIARGINAIEVLLQKGDSISNQPFNLTESHGVLSPDGNVNIEAMMHKDGYFKLDIVYTVPPYVIKGRGEMTMSPLAVDFEPSVYLAPVMSNRYPQVFKKLGGVIPLKIIMSPQNKVAKVFVNTKETDENNAINKTNALDTTP